MRLWFSGEEPLWASGRLRYAAEQMLLTLFPGEKPVYPPSPAPRGLRGEEDAALFTLSAGKRWATLSVLVLRGGERRRAAVRFSVSHLKAPPQAVYHTLQHALKEAFYRAGTALLGHGLPWGSLTGVRPTKLPTRTLRAGGTPAQALGELERVYHVSPLRRTLAVECAKESVAAMASLRPRQVSLYVGIPFCPTRCVYCSFVSADIKGALSLVEPFLEALFREISAAGALLKRNHLQVRTLYVGGGTPTTLSSGQLSALLSHLEREIDLSACTERTVEAGRPDTITGEKLAVLAAHGVGRISINPQSMSDAVLAAIGRSHSPEEILSAYDLARRAGIPCINMDLIAGLPQDDLPGFSSSLNAVLALEPENITVHTLALKKGSRLLAQGGALPPDAEVARMLDGAWRTLGERGYRPYYLYRQKYMSGSFENVGWTKPGFSNLYNICMMEELHTVLALGAGGVTKLVDPGRGRIRRITAPKYPYEYIEGLPRLLEEKEGLSAFYAEMEDTLP